MAATSTLLEDWQWGTLDSTKWTTSDSADASQVTVDTTTSSTDFRLKISHAATSSYNSQRAVSGYDLTGSNFYVNVVDAGNQSLTSHEVILGFAIDANNSSWITISSNNVSAYKRVAGVAYPVYTCVCDWSPTRIRYRMHGGDSTNGPIVFSSEHRSDIPTPGYERVHFNVWIQNANSPELTPATSIVLRDFKFAPRKYFGGRLYRVQGFQ